MKMHYDQDVDAAYIYLTEIKDGGVDRIVSIDDRIALDFDKKGRLLGIEVLDASELLPRKTLAAAKKIGKKKKIAKAI